MAKKASKSAAIESVPAVTPAPAAVPEEKLITTKDLAAKLGTKPTTLRRYLRTLPHYQDKTYTRYGWKEDDPFLSDVESGFTKYQTAEKEKNVERLKTTKEKKEAKAAAITAKTSTTAPSAPAPIGAEDEDADLELDDDSVELEDEGEFEELS
jgi:phage antirepressor YoqD-like protein